MYQLTGSKETAEFQKGKDVHISINNSDGRQQILTGAHFTHSTNETAFQVDVHSEERRNPR